MIRKLILINFCLGLVGCAGMGDYEINLGKGYRIDRLSAHEIEI